jgi:hypothetical protein
MIGLPNNSASPHTTCPPAHSDTLTAHAHMPDRTFPPLSEEGTQPRNPSWRTANATPCPARLRRALVAAAANGT